MIKVTNDLVACGAAGFGTVIKWHRTTRPPVGMGAVTVRGGGVGLQCTFSASTKGVLHLRLAFNSSKFTRRNSFKSLRDDITGTTMFSDLRTGPSAGSVSVSISPEAAAVFPRSHLALDRFVARAPPTGVLVLGTSTALLPFPLRGDGGPERTRERGSRAGLRRGRRAAASRRRAGRSRAGARPRPRPRPRPRRGARPPGRGPPRPPRPPPPRPRPRPGPGPGTPS